MYDTKETFRVCKKKVLALGIKTWQELWRILFFVVVLIFMGSMIKYTVIKSYDQN